MAERRRPVHVRLDQSDYDRASKLAEALTSATVSDVLRTLIREALDARSARVAHPSTDVVNSPARVAQPSTPTRETPVGAAAVQAEILDPGAGEPKRSAADVEFDRVAAMSPAEYKRWMRNRDGSARH